MPYVANRYFVVRIGFVVWMLFFDQRMLNNAHEGTKAFTRADGLLRDQRPRAARGGIQIKAGAMGWDESPA